MERLRLRKARGREARRKEMEKAGRFLTHCNAMKMHAANKVQRRKRHEAANQRRDEAQAEKWERREDAERASDAAQVQLDAAEDGESTTSVWPTLCVNSKG